MTAAVRAARPAAAPASRLAHTTLRCALAGGTALAAAALHDAHDPGVLCPLRLLTGIPCPFCGSTTVFIEAGHGHWLAALTANPVSFLAVLGALAAPLCGGVPWWPLTPRRRTGVVVGALAVAWLWQLKRLGV